MNIKRGGWLEFGEGYSEHRILYFDINSHILLERKKNSSAPRVVIRLHCRDPRTVDRYDTILEQQYQHHNFMAHLEAFECSVSYPIEETDMMPLIKLDRLNTQIVRHAKKKCKKLKMGAKTYTPELHKLGLTIYFYHLLEKKQEGRKVSSRYLRRLANQCDISNYSIIPAPECRCARCTAQRAYRIYSKDAELKRPAWLDGLAGAIAAKGDIQQSSAIRQLKSQEESRHAHRTIRIATNDFDGAPYHMELQGSNGTYISTDKEEIE